MDDVCGNPVLLTGPLFSLLGVWTFTLGIASWRRPESEFVKAVISEPYPTFSEAAPIARFFGYYREKREPQSLWSNRILGPVNGAVFFVAGCFMTYTQVRCAIRLGSALLLIRPLIGPLQIKIFPPMLIVTIPLLLIVGLVAWGQRPLLRIPALLVFPAFLFCGFEAASFHVGIMAERWAAIGIFIVLLWAIIALIYNRRGISSHS